jgi:uncharacterized membrane protein YfcA
MQTVLKNWKTSLGGLVTLLLGVPTFVSAIQAWGNHQPVDWRSVLVSTTLSIVGVSFLAAKDATTHSTSAEIQQADTDAAK